METETHDAIPQAGVLNPDQVTPTSRQPRWPGLLAFAAGGGLTAVALAVALQTGAFDALANIRTPSPALTVPAPADPRIERLVKLLESERDCDSDCLADLRGRADKSAALEQALGRLQESAAEAEQRRAALESEKTALAEETARKMAALETGYKEQLAALESENAGLAGQVEKKAAELETKHRQQVAALEAEKTTLTARFEKMAAHAEAAYQQKVAALEKQLDDAKVRLQTAMVRQEPAPGRNGKSLRTVPTAPGSVPPAAPAPVASTTSAPASLKEAPKWTVLGMTATTVVVSTANHRVVALAAGESLDGVKVQHIDLDHGVAETSAGNLTYRQ